MEILNEMTLNVATVTDSLTVVWRRVERWRTRRYLTSTLTIGTYSSQYLHAQRYGLVSCILLVAPPRSDFEFSRCARKSPWKSALRFCEARMAAAYAEPWKDIDKILNVGQCCSDVVLISNCIFHSRMICITNRNISWVLCTLIITKHEIIQALTEDFTFINSRMANNDRVRFDFIQ